MRCLCNSLVWKYDINATFSKYQQNDGKPWSLATPALHATLLVIVIIMQFTHFNEAFTAGA